jgi:hypothetical protein
MGISKRPNMAVIKLTLPEAVADELRLIRDAAERGGYEFSLSGEIASALAQIRSQLPAELLNEGASHDS